MPHGKGFTLWVKLKKAAQCTGYTERALYGKISRGQLEEGIHWIKAPDGRLLIDMDALTQWIES